MEKGRRTEDHKNRKPYWHAAYRSGNHASFEDKFFTVVSLGTIISGGLACLASVGIGMSLVLLGSMVLAEL